MEPHSLPAFEFLQALRPARNRQATMESQSVTAVAPFRLLDLPREIRDDIYEAAIFDLSPPDMFTGTTEPDSARLRKMDTNILLTSRQVYWEARHVIVHRGQLILASIERLGFGLFEVILTDALSGIAEIDPMYENLCIMSHRIECPVPPGEEINPANEIEEDYEFILHRRDAESFCRIMMGDYDCRIGMNFSSRATHTLDLRSSPTYGQHEFNSVHAAQTLVLQKYRRMLRNFEHFFIVGPSTGWENGLYGAVLQEVRSIDDRAPTELIDDIRTLEQKGSQILLQTGDVEAADVFWESALAKCFFAQLVFKDSGNSSSFLGDHVPEAVRTHVQRWIRLRRQHGNECAVPLLELWYKLIHHRLSGALRFFEQGHHLKTRHGRPPRPTDDYLDYVSYRCGELREMNEFFEVVPWSPQPADEAQLCLTAASIFRILDTTVGVQEAYRAILRASELAPDDEPIRQERGRVDAWIRRLVDDGTLEHFPSSRSLTEPWWSTFDIQF